MRQNVDLMETVELCQYSQKTVKFSDDFHFNVKRKLWTHNIYKTKGDFEITKITEICDNGVTREIEYDKDSAECVSLEEFYLHGYDSIKFTYYVKKIKADFSEGTDIEIDILNPFDVEILENSETPISNETCSLLSKIFESAKHSSNNESRPQSVVSQISLNESVPKLFKLGPHLRYSDVYFIASDQTKVPSHRCILAEFSDTFAKIFDETFEIPVHISAENFDAETIQSALNYLYDKSVAIYGKEINVLKFAIEFRIQHLINICVSIFDQLISVTNVCEFIQISYANNLEELKQKCLKVLVENKEEINPAKIAQLPKNIIYDAFFFKL